MPTTTFLRKLSLSDLSKAFKTRKFYTSVVYEFSEDYKDLESYLQNHEELKGENKKAFDYSSFVGAYVDFVGVTIKTSSLNVEMAQNLLNSLESLDDIQCLMSSGVAEHATHYRQTLSSFISEFSIRVDVDSKDLICSHPIPVILMYKIGKNNEIVEKGDREIKSEKMDRLNTIIKTLEKLIKNSSSTKHPFDMCLADQWTPVLKYYKDLQKRV